MELGRRERQIMEAVYRLGRATVAEVRADLPDAPSYSAVRGMLRVAALPPPAETVALSQRPAVAPPPPVAAVQTRRVQPALPPDPLPDPVERAPLRSVDWGRVARLIWASVAIALLLRIAAGDLQLRGIARRAERAVGQEWIDLLHDCMERLGVRRQVALLQSSEVEVPITWGTLRPHIVIPASASDWSRAQKRAVLLHELAHVERHDALTQRVARVSCALHWPNPLAWAGAAAMRMERERACDDRVLAEGARPTEYASSLLEIARTTRPGGGRTALAMARRAQLEGRVLAVLDPAVDRQPVNRRRAAAVATAAAFLIAPLAAVRAERAVSPPAQAAVANVLAEVPVAAPPTPPTPPTPATPP